VVDDSSNTLIGHVVGTDFLGDVYVVPILDTLNDIRNNLNALLVTFPTPEDFIDFADDQSDAGSESTRENWQSVRSYLASTGVHDENLPVEGERKQLTTATGTSTERPSALSTDSRPISINSTARTTVTIESVAKYGSDWKMFSFASSRRRPVQMCVQTVKDFIQFVNETSLQFIGEDGAGEQRHYITQSALERYWTIDRVQDILTAFRLHLSAENVQRDYMRILSILTVCNKTEYLTEFTKLDLLDNAIPLKEAPRAWPVAFTNLYDDFYSHQWKFCPFQINPLSMHTKHLSKEYTLPPGQIETLNSNGDYDLIKVTLDHNCIKSKVSISTPCHIGNSADEHKEIDDKNQRVYIFKMFKETTVAHFLAEEEAYKHVSERGLQPESLIKYYGSFVHDGRPGILLEHQEHISLDDFLSNTEPPTSSSDIMQFWASVSNLVSTLYMLHSSLQPSESPFDDIHGNISPDNIFIFRSSTTPYNFRFKILDFGTSTSRRLNRQTRYSPPTLDYTGPLSANDDIWSLGCLFSEISVWLVLGQKGLMAYSDMRSAEIALESEGANALSPAHSAAFHNGRQRLRCVSRMHEAALQHLKAPGSITKKVTNLVEIYMLKVRPTRLGARDVNRMVQKILAEAKAEIISEQSTDNRKGQMNSFFIASDSDVVAGSVDNNRNMAAKTTTQEMNFNGAESVSENLYRQMNPGDIINTRKAGQSSLDRPASRSLTLGRPLTLAEVMNYRRAKKQQTPADSWVASTVSNITNSLKGRDFMFIVDDSSSMSKHKGEVLDMIEALSWLLKQTDPDGIELSISSSANPYHARTTSSLMAFLENTSTWSQKTQADYILDTVSKRVETYWKSIGRRLIRRRPKPLNIFVLTDGMWETSTSNTVVAEAGYMRLEEVARCLMAANLPRTFYSIQFIRFGNDRSGASYLKHLDDIGRDFRFEIVDTKASTDDVWSILCGSLSESVDHAEES
jgi:hypothetical protein